MAASAASSAARHERPSLPARLQPVGSTGASARSAPNSAATSRHSGPGSAADRQRGRCARVEPGAVAVDEDLRCLERGEPLVQHLRRRQPTEPQHHLGRAMSRRRPAGPHRRGRRRAGEAHGSRCAGSASTGQPRTGRRGRGRRPDRRSPTPPRSRPRSATHGERLRVGECAGRRSRRATAAVGPPVGQRRTPCRPAARGTAGSGAPDRPATRSPPARLAPRGCATKTPWTRRADRGRRTTAPSARTGGSGRWSAGRPRRAARAGDRR